MAFKLTILVVIGTDYTGSCKSNYHMITTMMASGLTGSTHIMIFYDVFFYHSFIDVVLCYILTVDFTDK